MIEVVGEEGSDEYRVASAIAIGLEKLWPGLQTSPAAFEHVRIAANTKLSGYKVSDVDVVVAAAFKKPRYFVPTKALQGVDGRRLTGVKIGVNSLLVAVEVKGQPNDGIRVVGGEISVRYKEGWKSATAQNIEQVHALKRYFEDQHLDAFVYRCLVLQGIDSLPVDNGRHVPESGAVNFGFSGAEFLTAIAGVNSVLRRGREFFVSSFDPSKADRVFQASIFKTIVPSRLDRAKMDQVAKRGNDAKSLADDLGHQMIRLMGHGGTGKTIMLLQAAHDAFVRRGKQCIVLTYNVALAADINRLLALLKIPGASEGGGVEVRTVMSFIFSWLNRLGLDEGEKAEGFDGYIGQCKEALAWIDSGTVSQKDICNVKEEDGGALDFDVLLVDEAQDWPQPEADLLTRLYNPSSILIADGRDQLIRGTKTNWHSSVGGKGNVFDISLGRSLRMKRNLGIFANSVANSSGLNWSVEPNDKAAGGKVILSPIPYKDLTELQQTLLTEAKDAGNSPIDFLHCVPASEVSRNAEAQGSLLASSLCDNGAIVWDGTNSVTRKDFPRSVDALRVVQYESCRGLEGWTTVLDGLDAFWDRKFAEALTDRAEESSYLSAEQYAAQIAWRFVMIALTRPIDTLVITVRNMDSPVGQLLQNICAEHIDFVSWV